MSDFIDPNEALNVQNMNQGAPRPEPVVPPVQDPNATMGGFRSAQFAPVASAPSAPPVIPDQPEVTQKPDVDVAIPGEEEEEDVPLDDTVLNMKDTPVETPAEEMSDKILDAMLGEAIVKDDKSARSAEALGLTIPLSTYDKVRSGLEEKVKEIGSDAWERDKYNNNTPVGVIFDSTSYFQAQMQYNKSALELIKGQGDTLKDLKSILTDNIPGTLEGLTKKAKDPVEKLLSGRKARGRIISQIQGVRRIPLWNSGFFITLKSLALGEISQFINMCINNGYVYTREMGGFFYLFSDISIKDLIMTELFPKVIMDSNLKDWNRMGKDIIKHVSLHDYDTILWALSTMMFREGVNIKHYCAEKMPGTDEICGNIDERMTDLTKLRLMNMDLITKPMIEFMNSNGKVTVDEVEKYRKNILKEYPPFRFTVDNPATGVTSHWQIDFRVPTGDEYLMYGADYNNSMVEVLGADSNSNILDRDDVNSYITVNYYKILIPWFDKLHEIRDIDGTGPDNIICTVENNPYSSGDRSDIKDILDTLNAENIGLDKAIHEYVKATKITHIAYQYDTCPVCGNHPSTAIDGFIPYDVQAHFFMLCLIRQTAK